MLVKLSGERYISTEHIESIERNVYTESKTHWHVRMVSGDVIRLNEDQYEQLLDALKQPAQHGIYDSDRFWKREKAERTLIGQLGAIRWQSLSEDAQYDAISAEVEREL